MLVRKLVDLCNYFSGFKKLFNDTVGELARGILAKVEAPPKNLHRLYVQKNKNLLHYGNSCKYTQ